ncbi:MAG: aldo/keto reductase [Firmicutes bacterium]|jgi:aryl-alcohol dehydrogenase-like predicted oxidoreductase|nr:aldo/keto reductase [Bacillota bacterium]NBI62665.1 aldo/keto reductase [Clostridiales bacterium]
MQDRVLGNGLKVSAVGLGCMGFSHAYGRPTEKKEAISLIQQAADMGYTFFDTAEVYGTPEDPHQNEVFVGEALKRRRDKVVIATKFGIRFDLESSEVNKPLVPDSRPEDTMRRAHGICPVTAIQNRYSMMARWYESLFPVLEELHIGYMAFSPLANGFLTARYGKDSSFEAGSDYRSIMPQFTPEAMEQNKDLLDLLKKLAEEKSCAPGQVSLAWMLCKKPYIVPIPGTRKAGRLRENAAAADITLSPQEISELDKALDSMAMSDVFGGTKVRK